MFIVYEKVFLTHKWDSKYYYNSRVRVDLGVMAFKKYATIPRTPERGPNYRFQFGVIFWTPERQREKREEKWPEKKKRKTKESVGCYVCVCVCLCLCESVYVCV